ncbi:MAG: hypothetical protein U9R51_02420 [Actinomycetota bacterium]|nr:hypothetical protein [Actinomycetota bacterium]
MQVSRFLRVLVVLSALMLLVPVAAAADPGATQERPFKAEWSGPFVIFPDANCGEMAEGWVGVRFAVTDGHITHMGSVTGWGQHCDNLVTGEMNRGVGAFVAANGDELHLSYGGQLGSPLPDGTIPIFAEEVFNGGTGRFSNATGGSESLCLVTFLSETHGVVEGTVVGTISYDASDRSK